MTLGRSPPSTVPTLTVTPRAGSLSAKSFWMTWESSRIALTPRSGSSPACAARPLMVIVYLPTPLRAVFNAPAGPSDGSRIRARSAARASRVMCGAESRLPISSSELRNTIGTTDMERPRASIARSANTSSASPPFMSNTPGPRTWRPSYSKGIVRKVPTGHTVS